MTDIDTSPEAVERLASIDLDIMLICGTCSEDYNCHPPSEMWIRRATGRLICDGCADDSEIPVEGLTRAPDPVRILRALSAQLTESEAELARLRAALRVNALRLDPGLSHAQITAEIDRIATGGTPC